MMSPTGQQCAERGLSRADYEEQRDEYRKWAKECRQELLAWLKDDVPLDFGAQEGVDTGKAK